jgi:superfamily II DNA or RNA helicase
MDAGTRRELLSDLGTGRIKVLTSCALIGEGVDVPSVGGCILLRPTASTSLHLQMIGRCLRPSPGKAAAVVLDHVGNTLRLGHHLEPREWTLDGLAKRDREKAPSVKVCPQCFAASMSAAQVCRECGHVFAPLERRELQQVEGELVELGINIQKYEIGQIVDYFGMNCKWQHNYTIVEKLDNNEYKIKKWNQHTPYVVHAMHLRNPSERSEGERQRREQGTAQSLDDLRQLAQQRGYKRGWAERVYQARLAKRYGG